MTRTASKTIRCAIYTRKSTEEGLDLDYNTLHAQRDAAEAFIASQKAEGWMCLPEHYDDGGFSGANLERPALQRLLRDVMAGAVDCIIVYKVDRITRSLLDFAQIVAVLEKHGVSFVSVTQQFNTTHSMGRLTLNMLLSFSQFEREIISERTRDKIAATRRKGLWTGGQPPLGYGVDRSNGSPRLVVNREEAEQVSAIFKLYVELGSLLKVVKKLNQLSWRTKIWTTKQGRRIGGRTYTKGNLYGLLTNVLYAGKVRYKDEVHVGRHEAIVSPELWRDVQVLLQNNGREGRSSSRTTKCPALLRGLLYCHRCGYAMSPTYTSKGNKRYRYYVCIKAQKQGHQACPGASVPAAEIEHFVVGELLKVARSPELALETLEQVRRTIEAESEQLRSQRKALSDQLKHDHKAIRELLATSEPSDDSTQQLATLQDRARDAEQRLRQVEQSLAEQERQAVDPNEVTKAFEQIDTLWQTLSTQEQTRTLQLLIDRVRYDGSTGDESVEITYRPSGTQASPINGAKM